MKEQGTDCGHIEENDILILFRSFTRNDIYEASYMLNEVTRVEGSPFLAFLVAGHSSVTFFSFASVPKFSCHPIDSHRI